MAHPVSFVLSGTQGDALEYELAQSGFSVQILDKASVLHLTLLNSCMLCSILILGRIQKVLCKK